MRDLSGESASWARQQFQGASTGDARRTVRLVNMATRAADRPAGKISEVCYRDSERQGAYDFLESDHVDVSSLVLAMGQASSRAVAAESFAFVAIDGASITLTDRGRSK